MKTLVVETHVKADGRLQLDVATDLPPGKVELVLFIQSLAGPTPPYPTLENRWRHLFPADYDLDTALGVAFCVS